jgi:hypothetical protein
MAGPAESREPWKRLAAEVRAYQQAQRQAWGDLDEGQLARYLDGACSPAERADVERATRELPEVRELMEVVRGALPAKRVEAPAQAFGAEVAALAASSAAGPATPFQHDNLQPTTTAPYRRRSVLRAALIVTGLAASFLLGVVTIQLLSFITARMLAGHTTFTTVGNAVGPSAPPGELLLASLTAVPRDSRAASGAQVTLDDEGVYRIGGKDFALQIRAPRRGMATIIVLGPGQPVVYPLPGQAQIAVQALESRKFGPLDLPKARTSVVVIVTAMPVADVVRRYLAGAGAALDQPERLVGQLGLGGAGQPWVAVGRITIEPMG